MKNKPKQSDFNITTITKTEDMGVNRWVYRSLRNAVMCGDVQPGVPLTIRGLAEKLDVSPMPVREALHRLSCEGAIHVKDNRRIVVPEMTAGKFKELHDLRIMLETYAAECALPYIRPEHIDELERLDEELDNIIEQQRVDEVTQANQTFHRCLYQLAPNQATFPMIESVWLQLGPFLRVVLGKLEETYHVDRHKEALDAIRKHNGFALKRAIEADIRDGMASLELVVADSLDG